VRCRASARLMICHEEQYGPLSVTTCFVRDWGTVGKEVVWKLHFPVASKSSPLYGPCMHFQCFIWKATYCSFNHFFIPWVHSLFSSTLLYDVLSVTITKWSGKFGIHFFFQTFHQSFSINFTVKVPSFCSDFCIRKQILVPFQHELLLLLSPGL